MMVQKLLRVAVAGASGYTGVELLRLLFNHPEVKISALTAEAHAGRPIDEVFPGLFGLLDLPCRKFQPEELAEAADVIFLALPHQTSMTVALKLYPLGCRIIDLSADFRLKDATLYERWYGTPHVAPQLLKEAAYGLPELNREVILRSRLVAVPGCYPTGALLGLAPLVTERMIGLDSIIVDAISGASGAGRKAELSLSFSELNENLKAYGVASHRHTPEMEQVLSHLVGEEVQVTFTPHLAPMTRGILSTIYCRILRPVDIGQLVELFRAFYQGCPFIRILPKGRLPETKAVFGSNFCDIGLAVDERTGRTIVITAIDNLVKGASGQAVQVMNLMFRFDERLGLLAPGLFP